MRVGRLNGSGNCWSIVLVLTHSLNFSLRLFTPVVNGNSALISMRDFAKNQCDLTGCDLPQWQERSRGVVLRVGDFQCTRFCTVVFSLKFQLVICKFSYQRLFEIIAWFFGGFQVEFPNRSTCQQFRHILRCTLNRFSSKFNPLAVWL